MDTELNFRLAAKNDLLDIVRMLADDKIGARRENFSEDLSANYLRAFELIEADKNQELTIVELKGEKVATFHLTFIQYLTHQGGLSAQIEAVRTISKYRGHGIGQKVFEYAINRAKAKGCKIIQLTTDKRRPEAIKFYQKLGFTASHEGMKIHFDQAENT